MSPKASNEAAVETPLGDFEIFDARWVEAPYK
jgi:hypothetical protein